MASNYGLNFGFRRSDETLSIREGRFMVPAAGTFRQGSYVVIDPAAAGFLKAAPADTAIQGAGLLVQEEAHLVSVYAAGDAGFDTFSSRLGVVQNGKRAII